MQTTIGAVLHRAPVEFVTNKLVPVGPPSGARWPTERSDRCGHYPWTALSMDGTLAFPPHGHQHATCRVCAAMLRDEEKQGRWLI
jgi:hypothetical protein